MTGTLPRWAASLWQFLLVKTLSSALIASPSDTLYSTAPPKRYHLSLIPFTAQLHQRDGSQWPNSHRSGYDQFSAGRLFSRKSECSLTTTGLECHVMLIALNLCNWYCFNFVVSLDCVVVIMGVCRTNCKFMYSEYAISIYIMWSFERSWQHFRTGAV